MSGILEVLTTAVPVEGPVPTPVLAAPELLSLGLLLRSMLEAIVSGVAAAARTISGLISYVLVFISVIGFLIWGITSSTFVSGRT